MEERPSPATLPGALFHGWQSGLSRRIRAAFVRRSEPEDHMDDKLDSEALSAAIAGFLACHVLTLQFLIKEGVIDRDRFIPFVESAMDEMRPGIADQRSLFVLTQVLKSLRAPGETVGLQ
jgi:hypothetical protein